MNTDKNVIRNKIEQQLSSRLGTQLGAQIYGRNGKPTVAALREQAAFLAGSMAALQAVFGSDDQLTDYAPPAWIIDMMRGKLVVGDRKIGR